jgi:hypothetical protein
MQKILKMRKKLKPEKSERRSITSLTKRNKAARSKMEAVVSVKRCGDVKNEKDKGSQKRARTKRKGGHGSKKNGTGVWMVQQTPC